MGGPGGFIAEGEVELQVGFAEVRSEGKGWNGNIRFVVRLNFR